MRRAISIKLAVLLPIVLLTRLVTGEIMARYPTVKDGPPKRPTLTKTGHNPANPPAGFQLPAPGASNLTASARLVSYDIHVEDNQVHVKTSVHLFDSRKSTMYLWRLRALHLEDEVTKFDRPYDTQIFEMDPSGQMSPNFSEVLPLPPGRYRILLSLYGVPRGFDLDRLKDVEVAQAQMLIQVPKDVEIF